MITLDQGAADCLPTGKRWRTGRSALRSWQDLA